MFYTERLLLRAFDPRCDTNPWTQNFNDTETIRTITNDGIYPKTAEEVKKVLESLSKHEKGSLASFAICLKPKDEELPSNLPSSADIFVKENGEARYPMIGVLPTRGAHGPSVSFSNRAVSFGIGFDKEHQGKGYGQEVLEWFCDYIFNQLGLHRIELVTDADNIAAQKCYKKVGFLEEGRMRKCTFRQGRWTDAITMAILEEDWQAKHEPSQY